MQGTFGDIVQTTYYYLDIINDNACIFKIYRSEEGECNRIDLILSMDQNPIYTLSKEMIDKIFTGTRIGSKYYITDSNLIYPKSLNIAAFIDAVKLYMIQFDNIDDRDDDRLRPLPTKVTVSNIRSAMSCKDDETWYFQKIYRDGKYIVRQLERTSSHSILLCMRNIAKRVDLNT